MHDSSFAQKTKKTPKVEVGTKTTDASMDEWLQVSYNAKCLLFFFMIPITIRINILVDWMAFPSTQYIGYGGRGAFYEICFLLPSPTTINISCDYGVQII